MRSTEQSAIIRYRFLNEDTRGAASLLVLPLASPAEIVCGQGLVAERSPVRVVAVDGGHDRCVESGLAVDEFVGDGDSVSNRLPVGMQRSYPVEKNFSDLRGALQGVESRGPRIVVVGTAGGRIDHEWINLLELTDAAERFPGITAVANRGLLFITCGGITIDLTDGTLFSVLPLRGNPRVTIRGARYSLEDEHLTSPSHGLSNLAKGRVELRCSEGCVALVVPD